MEAVEGEDRRGECDYFLFFSKIFPSPSPLLSKDFPKIQIPHLTICPQKIFAPLFKDSIGCTDMVVFPNLKLLAQIM